MLGLMRRWGTAWVVRGVCVVVCEGKGRGGGGEGWVSAISCGGGDGVVVVVGPFNA